MNPTQRDDHNDTLFLLALAGLLFLLIVGIVKLTVWLVRLGQQRRQDRLLRRAVREAVESAKS